MSCVLTGSEFLLLLGLCVFFFFAGAFLEHLVGK
jgi:hypothetical protein